MSLTASRSFRVSRFVPLLVAAGLFVAVPPALAQDGSAAPEVSTPRYSRPRPVIYFPPNPPALGAPPPIPDQTRWEAPVELAEHVADPFYAPLSTRIHQGTLTRRLNERLETYRANKLALQNELRAKLQEVAPLEPEARRQALEEFARVQEPRLVELEAMAEALRSALITLETDWNVDRSWKLGDDKAINRPLRATPDVIRAAASYQNGLSPAQRHLVREIAMELEWPTRDPEAAAQARELLFFSPATARVRLPDHLPPELAAKVAQYETEKSALKKELFDVLFERDSDYFAITRTMALRALARRQEPRIDALETLAEEIRRDLMAHNPEHLRTPSAPPVPPALASRLADYLELEKESTVGLISMISEAREIVPGARVRSVSQGDSATMEIWLPNGYRNEAQRQQLKQKVDEFNERRAAARAQMNEQRAALREQIAHLHAGSNGRDADHLLERALDAVRQTREWMNYQDYRTAVFEPGLSPEQRRLLFGGALEQLDLMLPGGETSPR